MLKVYPYKQGSASAKFLAKKLGTKVLRREGSSYTPKAGDVLVNWGSSVINVDFPRVLNPPPAVQNAANKLVAFKLFGQEGVPIPPWADNRAVAEALLFPVVCRTVLQGHSGAGIVITDDPSQLVDAPLYTQYVKKKHEYRVHVIGDDAFFVQRKARKNGVTPNWQVRNLAGGFVFVVAENVPTSVTAAAVAAIKALNLDFGGVDILWNDAEQRPYVLEVNTACGLEDRTADAYATAIKEFLNV